MSDFKKKLGSHTSKTPKLPGVLTPVVIMSQSIFVAALAECRVLLCQVDGDRKIEKLELWYAKAKPNSRRPEIKVWGRH